MANKHHNRTHFIRLVVIVFEMGKLYFIVRTILRLELLRKFMNYLAYR